MNVVDGPLEIVLIVAAGLLALAVVVLVVAWRRARRRAARVVAAHTDVERQRIALELELAEQMGRLRIVRELHEVSIPSLSAIITQAEAARYAASSDLSAVSRVVDGIEEAARTTLGDLRRVMAVVQEGEASAPAQPQVTSMEELFAVMRESGLAVEFEQTGEPFDLQQGAELVVSRIVHEALSNARRYGGPGTTARVAFTWSAEGLQIRVDDDGIRAAARREGLDPNDPSTVGYSIDDDLKALTHEITGRGLREMRARAEIYGGIVNASTVPGVGFSLSVVFPALRFHNGVHGVRLARS